jgi:WD40 repeat protein
VGGGEAVATIDGDTAHASRILWLGASLAWSSSKDGSLHVWDVAGKKETLVLVGKDNAPTTIALAPDGKTVAIGDYAGKLLLHDTGHKTSSEVALGP